MAQLVSASRGSGSPLIKSRTSALSVRKAHCYAVACRSMRPGPNHGAWQLVSRDGWTVVCPSRLEASELVWFVGGRLHPRPADLDHGDDKDEERYLDWLLAHHFRIVPHRATGRMEVMFSEWLNGWYPDTADILRETRVASSVLEPILRSRWEGK